MKKIEEHNKRIDEGDVELLKKNFGSDEDEAARGEWLECDLTAEMQCVWECNGFDKNELSLL